MIMYRIFILLVLFFSGIFADVDNSLKEVEILYRKAVSSGDSKSIKEAEKILNNILKDNPTNAKALVFLGGIYTIKAKKSKMPWNKMKYVKRGLGYMDKGVNIKPDNIDLRIERALNNMNLPSFFGRKGVVEKDFDFIITNKKFMYYPAHIKQMIYFKAGIFYKDNSKLEQAKKMWKQVLIIDKTSDYAKEASKYIEDFDK